MNQIEADAELELQIGDFPAVESLAFAVLEGKDRGDGMTLEEIHELQRKHGMIYD